MYKKLLDVLIGTVDSGHKSVINSGQVSNKIVGQLTDNLGTQQCICTRFVLRQLVGWGEG